MTWLRRLFFALLVTWVAIMQWTIVKHNQAIGVHNEALILLLEREMQNPIKPMSDPRDVDVQIADAP